MRTLQSAAILLGLSAGLGAVFNSPAQAQVQTCSFTSPPSNIVCGIPALASPVFAPDSISAGAGTISFENPAGGSMYSVKTGFAPTINTASVTEQFKYSLTLTDGKIWGMAGLTTNMLAGFPGGKFSKQICADAAGTDCITADELDTLTLSNTGVSGFIDISDLNTNKIYVTDTYQSVVGNPMGYGQISDFTNTFEAVPGPLPVLGAGAAFGFSRKLRKRIKSAG
jgi:hypothetical protein